MVAQIGAGLESALGVLGASAMGGPIALGLGALVTVGGAIKKSFDDATAAAKALQEQSEAAALSAARIEASLVKDPKARANAELNVKLGELETETAFKLARTNDLRRKKGTFWEPTIQAELGLDDGYLDPDIAKAERERDDSGRDERGNHIGVAAEQQLKLAAQRLAYDKQHTKLLEQEKRLQTDLLQVEEDRKKTVSDIQNEGIAVREKSEFEDKTARIAKVNADAAKRTSDISEQIADTKTAIADLDAQNSVAVDAINDGYRDRLKLLDDEIAKQSLLLDLARQQAAAAGRAVTQAAVSGTAMTNLNTDPNLGGGGQAPWR